jgi:hypothetical protein
MTTRPCLLETVAIAVATSGSTINLGVPSLTDADADCIGVYVAWMPTGITGTALSASAGLLVGSWSLVARYDSAVAGSYAMEVWVGYNFLNTGVTSSTLTLTLSGSTTNRGARVSILRCSAPQTALPVTVGTAAGASGTGTSADPGGTLTPAVGDLIIQGHMHLANSAPTAYAHTPTDQALAHEGGASHSSAPLAYRHETLLRVATSTAAHKRVSTIATSVAWVTLITAVRPIYDTTTGTAHVYKGRDLASLDTSGAV